MRRTVEPTEPFAPGDEALRAQVYAWAYRILQNHHDALDATQDVLVKWLQREGDPVENRRAWLRRITVNHCIDRTRLRKRPPLAGAKPTPSADPADETCAREQQVHIQAALQTLSEQQRAVLVAKVFDRETFAAIAVSMALSVSTVKTHYLRALRAMRTQMRHSEEDVS